VREVQQLTGGSLNSLPVGLMLVRDRAEVSIG
jgi:hypothetical protein